MSDLGDRSLARHLRRELLARNSESQGLRNVLDNLSDEQLILRFRENQGSIGPVMMKARRREKGAAELISILIAALITMVLLSALIPSFIHSQQANNSLSAASVAQQIQQAEFAYQKSYGAVIPFQAVSGTSMGLTGSLAQPIGCANPMLLPGIIANQAPNGYAITFTPNILQASFSCASTAGGFAAPIGYQGFNLNLDPANTLQAKRHFFTCSGGTCDGLIHFNDSQPASASDPVFNVALSNGNAGGGGSGTNNNGVGSNLWGGVWGPSSQVATGEEFLRPIHIAGDSCSPASPDNPTVVGVFISLNGTASDPCQDLTNWFYTGTSTPVWNAAAIYRLSETVSSFGLSPHQAVAWGNFNNTLNGASTFRTLGITSTTPVANGGAFYIGLFVNGSISPISSGPNGTGSSGTSGYGSTYWYCAIQSEGTSCTVSSNSEMTINPGDSIVVGLNNPTGVPVSITNVTITLTN